MGGIDRCCESLFADAANSLFKCPRIGAPSIVFSLEAAMAATACSSDSNVTYQVFPISGLADFGAPCSVVNTLRMVSSVAEAGMSRSITVSRSFVAGRG